ncbi:uncharacterized protein TRAVEDRAFT_43848 [Trametes versicolor FP-101664 SS1]|uniref:uncharacterized protein n=1 Tax=Trametes versicolor (strain FP-101664) TaxID=717944 RepID=UPI0004621F22|nr:uncharacterized protein TRAVEDRAFT_43848 [Trametes versicolor FP-101664 SS1]EIW63560.1 hypothetical protein TRAVEDRAFT_43848 [Trametes versicolor FP-101664 SS1]
MTVFPSPVVDAMTPEQSREIALHGHRALTPILSGAISGGIVGVAWIIGIIVWLYKRHRRARRAKAAGFRSHREFLDPPKKQEAFIIPPDPAVIQGQVKPGQQIVVEDVQMAHLKPAKTVPAAAADGERRHGEKEDVPPGMAHRGSAPCRVPDEPRSSFNDSGEERGEKAQHTYSS